MPRASTSSDSSRKIYKLTKPNDQQREVFIRDRSPEKTQVYVEYANDDTLPDEWVPANYIQDLDLLDAVDATDNDRASASRPSASSRKRRTKDTDKQRKRRVRGQSTVSINDETGAEASASTSTARQQPPPQVQQPVVETASGTIDRAQNNMYGKASRERNFDEVLFGRWKIKTWFYSPYPLTDTLLDVDDLPPNSALARSYRGSDAPPPRYHRSRGRMTDLLSGGGSQSKRGAPVENSYIFVCDRCFKYFSECVVWDVHQKNCEVNPPGRQVYKRDPVSIWEVDCAVDKLYCQNLALFGKLFIDQKTIFFDLDNFLFYVLTTGTPRRQHVIGYFSKEKVSFDDYNLGVIITFPQYQRQGYGALMIEFSYELSRRTGKTGTPERPLSDLGLRSYLSYWVATIIRFLQHVLSVVDTEGPVVTYGKLPTSEDVQNQKQKESIVPKGHHKGKFLKIVTALDGLSDPIFTEKRRFEMVSRPEGGAQTNVYITCTLEDIARNCNLRLDDAAFALNECGLLYAKYSDDSQFEPGAFVITKEAVERIAKERNIIRNLVDLNCVLL